MSVEWCESAIVLAARPHGESSVIATLLTANYGAHAGLVQAARSKKGGGIQPGNRVLARWRARLPEHLGSYTIEAESNGAAALMHEPLRLVALQSACSLVAVSAPEREPHPGLYEATAALIDTLPGPAWDAAYFAWEVGLLRLLGFGLDLERCAATGVNDMLTYVSPRTGRAISDSASEPWRDRLLKLKSLSRPQRPKRQKIELALSGKDEKKGDTQGLSTASRRTSPETSPIICKGKRRSVSFGS